MQPVKFYSILVRKLHRSFTSEHLRGFFQICLIIFLGALVKVLFLPMKVTFLKLLI
jgi:hypothetical protein